MGNNVSGFLTDDEKKQIEAKWGSDIGTEFAEALELFNKLDFTSDGMLNKEEFSKSLGLLGVQASSLCDYLFRAIDLDSNGSITFFEFLWFMLTVVRSDVEPKLEFAFRLIDIDKSGTITQDEIRIMVETMYSVLTHLKLKTPEVDQFVKNLSKKLNFDSEGKIDLQRWKQGCLKNEAFIKSLGSHRGSKKKKSEEEKPSLRLGKTVFFGQGRWDFMLRVMLGLQIVIEKSPKVESKNFTSTEYAGKEKYSLDGTGRNVVIVAYAPQVYRSLRSRCGITSERFLLSLGIRSILGSLLLGDLSSLSSLVSEGKSGSFFYWSHDAQFMVKTISKDERRTLIRMTQDYYNHLKNNPNTLLTKIYGLYQLKTQGEQNLQFVVMGNVFNTSKSIDLRFDLKGSTVGRTVGEENMNKKGVVYKDLDWKTMKRKINVAPKYVPHLKLQLQKDVELLGRNNIIDYSLLIGVHQTGTTIENEKQKWVKTHKDTLHKSFTDLVNASALKKEHILDQLDFESFCQMAYKHSSSSTENDSDEPLKRTSPSLFQKDFGGMKSYRVDNNDTEIMGEEIIFVGIIDTLIAYEWKKQSEHLLKSLMHDGNQISVIPPAEYKERFLNFVNSAFEDTELVRASRLRSGSTFDSLDLDKDKDKTKHKKKIKSSSTTSSSLSTTSSKSSTRSSVSSSQSLN